MAVGRRFPITLASEPRALTKRLEIVFDWTAAQQNARPRPGKRILKPFSSTARGPTTRPDCVWKLGRDRLVFLLCRPHLGRLRPPQQSV